VRAQAGVTNLRPAKAKRVLRQIPIASRKRLCLSLPRLRLCFLLVCFSSIFPSFVAVTVQSKIREALAPLAPPFFLSYRRAAGSPPHTRGAHTATATTGMSASSVLLRAAVRRAGYGGLVGGRGGEYSAIARLRVRVVALGWRGSIHLLGLVCSLPLRWAGN